MNGCFQDRRLRRGHLGQREEPLAGGASEKVGQHHAGVFSDAYRSLDFMLQAKKKKDTNEFIYKTEKEPQT